MKNIIFLVIDSVFYDRIIESKNHPNTMPFLNSMRDKSIWCTNMYSEASYTEAALVSTLCGIDTLKNGGYIRKNFGRKNVLEVFKENGYRTFYNGFQPTIYPKELSGVTDLYYNVLSDFIAVWEYRLEYLLKLVDFTNENDKYLNLCIELLDENFKAFKTIFLDLKEKNKKFDLIIDRLDLCDLDENIVLLNNEYTLFKNNKADYLKSLHNLKTEHPIFKIKKINVSRNVSNDLLLYIENENKKLIKKINRLYFKYNIKNNVLKFGDLLNNINNIKIIKNSLNNNILYKKISHNNECEKDFPSVRTHINHFKKWLDNKSDDKPYFAYIHVDDVHYPEIFYTYDFENKKFIDNEFSEINKFINNLPKKYCGSLSYDLSLLYMDKYIKDLYGLVEKDESNSTYLVITADHGYSYSFSPSHYPHILNENVENYHIPFVILGNNIKPKEYDGYYNSKDIPSTILDFCNLKIPKEFSGKSIFSFNGRDFVLLENILGGCPDYHSRFVTIGARNSDYSVNMDFDMNKSFKDGCIRSVYNLKKDTYEYHNLKKYDKKDINKHINFIKKEFYLLKEDIDKNDFIK